MQTTFTTPPNLNVTQEDRSTLKRLLCVEDDQDTCEVLRFVMTNYEFHVVGTVSAALELIDERPFDLYVLDNWLPDGSGVELCKHIRASGNAAPIIFTSAIGQLRDIEVAQDAGATRYFVKPYEPDALLRAVKELLDANDLVFKS